PTLVRFGQVALPPGVVEAGEVADPGIVGDAIKRLWKQAKFSTKKVALGVANQRVVVRPAEMPAMDDDELRTAIEFQADELIPLPLADAVLDYQILETFVSEENQEMVRVLVVAAQRDMVNSLLSAVRAAGLKPTTIDIVPFALVRGAATLTHFEELSGGAEAENVSGDYERDDSSPFALDLEGQQEARGEAIINIGAGVTTVVVHEYGIPRFIRIITQGGLAITEAIQDDLGISLDEAEGLKRQVVAGDTESEESQAAFRAMSARLGALLDEIQGSLEYYIAQNESGPLERLVLTGGGSRIPGMSDRLQALLGVDVRRADALATMRLGKTGLTAEQLEDAQDLLPVPIGLALSGLPTTGGFRSLSLMPTDLAERSARNRRLALVGVGAVGLIGFLGWAYVNKLDEVSDAETAADVLEAEVVVKQAEVQELSAIKTLSNEVDESASLIVSALQYDVAWSKLVQEVATVMPNDVWISSLQASAPSADSPGSLTVAGNGADHSSSARWILRIDPLESVTGQWLPVSQLTVDDLGLGNTEASFSSDVVLSDRVLSNRAERYVGATDILGESDSDADPEAEVTP
ncbi:MAG: type IV pilus assembly protein PilM, partial [Acidimicrobiales bacterium]